jgi:hypothetical protein
MLLAIDRVGLTKIKEDGFFSQSLTTQVFQKYKFSFHNFL